MIDLEKLQQVLLWQEDLHLPDTLMQLIDQTVGIGQKYSRDNPADSTAIRAYDENHFKIAEQIHQIPDFRERIPQIIGKAEMLRYQELLESFTWTRFRKDLTITLLTWETLEHSHTPLPEPMFRKIMTRKPSSPYSVQRLPFLCHLRQKRATGYQERPFPNDQKELIQVLEKQLDK